ncbi:hypothetical protein L5515_014225 [Caenorhabditis briggsae]|uniref:Uncharacterized protein n=1 Tax=Caenorhabditis briggsae TaxID=6238 RepID=A0AAE9J6L1_CAEBR|nr:hypothetical protein L5515_014225 [Caenorhabditis briggsae]
MGSENTTMLPAASLVFFILVFVVVVAVAVFEALMERKAPADNHQPTGCGAQYTNVVVRNQDVARVLIESQCLPGRRTLIPISENHRNNRYTIINDQSLQRAQRVAEKYHENVVRLLDMIEYPECVGNTFKAMCGQIIVVDSLDCAREVAYTDGVKSRTLTKRGDDVRPTGVMSGGVSEHSKTPIINAVSGIHKQLDEIKALRVELTDIRKYISATESKHTKYKELNSKLQESERRLAVYQSNMKTSQAGMVQQDIDNLKNEIEPVDAEIADASLKLAALQKKITDLESKKHNDTQLREKRKAEICKQLKEIEARTAANNDNAAKARRAVLQIQAAVDELRNTINNEKTQCEKKQEELRELEESLPAAEAAYEAASKEHKEVSAKLHALKTEQRTIVDRLAKVAKDITMMRKEEAKLKSKIEDKEKEVVRLKESELAHKKFAASLLKKCEWLVDEQAHFNKKGGIYDFDGYTANKGNTEVKEYTEKIEKLERSLCMKNVSNLDTCEAKVMDIKNKRAKLTEDFNILKKTIAVLDRKKTDEIHRAHESVNADFGKIFHCLLPDASAELVPPEGKTVCDGVEVKVAFNGVVKDSLHELSGGQRSLVALSLILAMLKFKPAPLYILDEVDAALDLSHTANIGKMIKAHFRDSQFIIVSLKQGMFSNADALFQTHFADGHSSCTLMSGAELKKLQTDKKLAAQATEVAEAEKEATKKPSKKSAKKAVQNTDDEME